MADILLRDIPDDLLSQIDRRAKRLGLSRAAYLRRTLERERAAADQVVSAASLTELSELAADLDDLDVMARAWS